MTTIAIPSRTDTIRERLAERRLPRFEVPVPEPAVIPVSEVEPTNAIPVLVVDDEPNIRDTCAILLRHEGYEVTTCSRGQEAVELLSHRQFPIVVVDLHLPNIDGLAVLGAALAADPAAMVVVMTGRPTVESSVTALEYGAWEYLPKPFSATQLQILVGRAAHAVRSRAGAQNQLLAEDGSRPPALIGVSAGLRAVIDLAEKVAPTDASVFIAGENGSGKESIARFIHEHSDRADRPFVVVNCADLPESALQSGGTVFLDEVLEMPKDVQAKLLRAVEDGVNVRLIASTSASAEEAVGHGALRDDLLYQLRVVPINVPPLRERLMDIPLLANHFLETYWAHHRANSGPAPVFTDAAINALTRHPWLGNVRELQNVIEHAVVVASASPTIDAPDLALVVEAPLVPVQSPQFGLPAATTEEDYHTARDRTISEFELRYVTSLLERAGGNMSRAARIAGMDRATLYRLVERHDLQRGTGGGTAWLVERIVRESANGVNAVDNTNFGAF